MLQTDANIAEASEALVPVVFVVLIDPDPQSSEREGRGQQDSARVVLLIDVQRSAYGLD